MRLAEDTNLMNVQAKTYIELTVDLAGDYQPEEPMRGPSFSSAGEPGCGESVGDIDVAGLRAEITRRGGAGGSHTVTHDILEGVAMTPDVRRLLDNIVRALGEEAEEVLLEAARDY